MDLSRHRSFVEGTQSHAWQVPLIIFLASVAVFAIAHFALAARPVRTWEKNREACWKAVDAAWVLASMLGFVLAALWVIYQTPRLAADNWRVEARGRAEVVAGELKALREVYCHSPTGEQATPELCGKVDGLLKLSVRIMGEGFRRTYEVMDEFPATPVAALPDPASRLEMQRLAGLVTWADRAIEAHNDNLKEINLSWVPRFRALWFWVYPLLGALRLHRALSGALDWAANLLGFLGARKATAVA